MLGPISMLQSFLANTQVTSSLNIPSLQEVLHSKVCNLLTYLMLKAIICNRLTFGEDKF